MDDLDAKQPSQDEYPVGPEVPELDMPLPPELEPEPQEPAPIATNNSPQ